MTNNHNTHQFDPGEDDFFDFTDRMTDGDLMAGNDLEATALRVQQALRVPRPQPQSLAMPRHLKHTLWKDIMDTSNAFPFQPGDSDQRPVPSRFPSLSPSRTFPRHQRPAVGSFVVIAVVVAMLLGGIWQAGGFRDLLPGGLGDEPFEFASIPFFNANQDDGPDIVASPAASGICPLYEERPPGVESGSDLNIDAAGMRDLISVCVSDFTWPDSVQPDIGKLQARFPDGNWITDIVAPRSVLEGLNLCAWQHVWIVAMQNGDDAAAAENKTMLVDLLTAAATHQPQAGHDLRLDAVYADDVDRLADMAMSCYPMDWTVDPVEAPAGGGTENVAPATPATPTGCDLSRDMPIIRNGDLVDSSTTYLKLADGILSLVCGKSATELVNQVEHAMTVGYPGIVNVTFEPIHLATRRQGLLNVATGELLMYGAIPESVQYDTIHPEGSPWFIAPGVDDPTRWLLTDLRTFESRDITDDIGAGSTGASTTLLADYSVDSGTLLVGLVAGNPEAPGTPAPFHLIRLDSIDGVVTRVETGLEPGVTPGKIGIDAAGNVAFVYSWSETGPGSRLDVFDIANGTRPLQEDNVQIGNQAPLWTADRTTLVYTTANRVVAYDATTGSTTDLFVAPEGDTFDELTFGPDDRRILLPQYTPSINEDGDEDADLVAHLLIDVATGETQTIDGAIVAPNMGMWTNYQRYIATIPSYDAQPVTVTILDLETMEPVGDQITFPAGTDPVQLLGPDDVVSTADGTTMIIAFTPNNPTVVTVSDTGSELTTLFEAGEQPRFDASSLHLSRDGTWLSAQPDGSGSSATTTIVDLSATEPTVLAIDGGDSSYIDFVKGTDD